MAKIHSDGVIPTPSHSVLTPEAMGYRATPVVNSDFVMVNMAESTASPASANLIDVINTNVAAVGVTLGKTYPSMPVGVIVSANTTLVMILTSNGTTNVATGLTVPIGASIYLPINEASAATLVYTSVAVFSATAFFAK